MKKLLYLGILLSLVGCSESKKSSEELYREYQEAIKSEGAQIKKEKKLKSGDISFKDAVMDYHEKRFGDNGLNPSIGIYRFKDSGHLYRMYISDHSSGYNGYGHMSIVHDPDCPCGK